jgi:hypothetical protein
MAGLLTTVKLVHWNILGSDVKILQLWSSDGRLKLKVAPFPSILFSAQILPTILLEIYRPKPVPLKDFELNFVNNRGIISGSIPSQLLQFV